MLPASGRSLSGWAPPPGPSLDSHCPLLLSTRLNTTCVPKADICEMRFLWSQPPLTNVAASPPRVHKAVPPLRRKHK